MNVTPPLLTEPIVAVAVAVPANAPTPLLPLPPKSTIVGALVYPDPGLVMVMPVIVPVVGLKFAMAAAPMPPPPEKTTAGAPI